MADRSVSFFETGRAARGHSLPILPLTCLGPREKRLPWLSPDPLIVLIR